LKILLSRTDRIGDLILSTPAIASVRASFPEAHITMVTSPYNHVVMERNKDVDEIVDLPRDVKPGAFGKRFTGYDLAVSLVPREIDLSIVRASRARLRVGYTYTRRWLARIALPFYVNRWTISVADPELAARDPHYFVPHEVDQLLALVKLAGANTVVRDLRLELHDEDRASVAHLPERPLVFHLGERWLADGSTLASTLQLVSELQALGAPVVISCAPECEQYVPQFEALGATVMRGLGFYEWAALFERACAVVTIDTGATHVASAMRRPTLVALEHRFFRLNSQEWAPYRVPSVLIRKPENSDDESLRAFRAKIVAGVARLIDA
jgi:ADP-heptose:LPS heptosyltransferase